MKTYKCVWRTGHTEKGGKGIMPPDCIKRGCKSGIFKNSLPLCDEFRDEETNQTIQDIKFKNTQILGNSTTDFNALYVKWHGKFQDWEITSEITRTMDAPTSDKALKSEYELRLLQDEIHKYRDKLRFI